MSSTTLKGMLAGFAALAIAGTALAQGNPPNPAVKDPAVGAGQQSSKTTPMGTTGTPAGGSAASGTTAATPSTGSTTTMGASGTTPATSSSASTTPSADTSASSTTTGATSTSRTARADRN